MNTAQRRLTAFACAGLAILTAHSVQSVRSDRHLDSLLTEGVVNHQHNYDPVKEPARKARAWRLYQLWLVRDKRDVTPQIVPFLKDEYWLLRYNAARILGRTESPVAERHLQKLLTAAQRNKASRPVDPAALRLALARNRTRGLKGQAKLTAFAKGMGLSFDEAVRLPAKLGAERLKGRGAGSQGEKITREMVDMLYTMGKRGENTRPLVGRLTLLPAQRVLLQGVGLSPDQEAKRIVNYLANLNTITPGDMELTQLYLPSLGIHATQAVVQRLGETKGGRVSLGGEGRSALIDAVRWNSDPRALALLKSLRKSDDPWVRNFAAEMPKQIKLLGNWSSPFSLRSPTLNLF